jgi:carbon-monoxide dehydrogenase medium subunit
MDGYMPLWKHYFQPITIEGALQDLRTAPRPVAVVAGGSDLLLDIQQERHCEVESLVDITCIPDLQEIKTDDSYIYLGAAVTHNEIINNPLIKKNADCVVEGCSLIAGPQVRNVATIGGNVAHALPAGDGTISLLAIGAEAQLASLIGMRWLPIIQLFEGPGKTTFDREEEILAGFKIPLRKDHEGSAFQRVMRPQGVAIAIQNMAAWVKLDANKNIENVRISVGPAGPRPFRATNTEAFLCGKKLDEEILKLAALELQKEATFRTSPHRATAEYRKMLIPVLLKRVLTSAYQRAAA